MGSTLESSRNVPVAAAVGVGHHACAANAVVVVEEAAHPHVVLLTESADVVKRLDQLVEVSSEARRLGQQLESEVEVTPFDDELEH